MTQAAGITFVHENGASGDKLLPETMGGGCALFDYDNDGDVDMLLVNSSRWPWDTRPAPSVARHAGALPQRRRLEVHRRDPGGGTRRVSCYGMGAAVGDYDNDHDPDLFVSTVGPNRLFRNDGGTVRRRDRAGRSGRSRRSVEQRLRVGSTTTTTGGSTCSSATTFAGRARSTWSQDFSLDGTHRAYGPPLAFEGAFPYVYRNDGEGRFTDVSQEMGVQVTNPATDVPMAKSLGVVPVDLDRGRLDRRRGGQRHGAELCVPQRARHDVSKKSAPRRESPSTTWGRPAARWASTRPASAMMRRSAS